MNIDSFKIVLKCPDSQALLHAREDFPLSWHQKLALRGHLMICVMCSRSEQNIQMLRGQLQRWRAYGADAQTSETVAATAQDNSQSSSAR